MQDRQLVIASTAFGFILCLSSGLGQTFFISLFNQSLRETFYLSHGEIGSLYFAGTLASAITLVWVGKLIDTINLRLYTLFVTTGLAIAALWMANVSSAWMLIPGFYLLRLFGQGLTTHTGITTVSRLKTGVRGRALSIASLGFSLGEGALPLLVVPLLLTLGWRNVWLYCAVVTLILTTVATQFLLMRYHIQESFTAVSTEDDDNSSSWSRHDVLRDIGFWQMAPALFAPSIFSTGLFFHQQSLATWKGVPFEQWAASIWTFSITAVGCSVVAGHLVDRFGATTIVRFFLLPFTLALLVVGWSDHSATTMVYFALMGATVGIATPTVGSLWLELYGVKHIGAIRSLTHAFMVFGSALGPPMYGALLDSGVAWRQILSGSAIYLLLTTLLLCRVNFRRYQLHTSPVSV